MKTKQSNISNKLLNKIKNPDPLKGEDILIEDNDGKIIGIIIQPKAYKFFLEQIESRENQLDSDISEEYDKNSPTLNDLMEEK